ncbi:MAG: hypothetical protein AB1439_05050 [candidate division FCPU426 bacterium]
MKIKGVKLFSTILVSGLLSGGCVMNKLNEAHETIQLKQIAEGLPISVDIAKGGHWSKRMQAGPVVFNVLPQIVIWAEDKEGRFLGTLYITGADYKTFRHGGKSEKGAAFWAECFPVWAARLKTVNGTLPSKENPYTDAVTSATPMSSFTLKTNLPPDKPAFLYLEVNQSGDTNATYTDQNNDWAGQPSLIYRADISQMQPGSACKMSLAGHGGRIKDQPDIYPDVSSLDTALDQIQEITVSF